MAINKVVYGNQTLIDLTDSTLTSSDEIVEGVTAYDRSGNLLTGTADYMDKIDNPTANRVLIDDGNGQAIDSSVLISNVATQSDLSGKQDTLVSGTNIKTINSTSLLGSGNLSLVSGVKGNEESSYRSGNVNLTPANIGAVAIDGGYVKYKLADGSDTFAAFRQGGNLSSGTAVLGVYTYHASTSSYKSTVGVLVNSDGSRNFAILDDLSYSSGDTFRNTLGSTNYIMCSGVMASSSIVRFTIPIDKPITASSISFTTLNLTVYVAGTRIVNNVNVATNSSYTGKTYQINNSGITVQFTLPTGTTATAFEPVSVAIGNMTGTFS